MDVREEYRISQELTHMSRAAAAKDFARCRSYINKYEPRVERRKSARATIGRVLLALLLGIAAGFIEYCVTGAFDGRTIATAVFTGGVAISALFIVVWAYCRPIEKRLSECRFRASHHSHSRIIDELVAMSNEAKPEMDEMEELEIDDGMLLLSGKKLSEVEDVDVEAIEQRLIEQLERTERENYEESKNRMGKRESEETSHQMAEDTEDSLAEETAKAIEEIVGAAPEVPEVDGAKPEPVEPEPKITTNEPKIEIRAARPKINFDSATSLNDFQELFNSYWNIE